MNARPTVQHYPAPVVTELEAPPVPSAPTSITGPRLTPAQLITFYSPDEWEDFIREWAVAVGEAYSQIKRLGGSNDKGADVAAFKTDRGFEGEWDCFQAKHYAKLLGWSDAFPEILKIFVGTVNGHYILPSVYAFLSPKGCGTGLNRLLSKPTDLRQKFLEELGSDKGVAASLDASLRDQVRTLAETTDFAMFRSVELVDAIAAHRTTAYHVARFGGPLPPRPPATSAPREIGEVEARYVAQLMDVYREANPTGSLAPDTLHTEPRLAAHFQRQRESFYAAESLRLHARDAVPPGTFEALQDDVHSGVIEIAEADHATSMTRLTQVLQASTQIDLSAHALTTISRTDDRKGICHQLANEDRLTWMRADP
ncbi:hypothetical protein EDD28_1219 [Salana multivorans]|uniref:ABC-three component systems C-terminal domain-containing protein n=1 Tax=Salana multivorans TaxID=120377 RepID=A0A3N2DA84_9MICO|nr:hypothetical protein EDD28_1219 [Salana multivorans]